jgi:lipopolysaccharide biosynthesis glycosyltransferase
MKNSLPLFYYQPNQVDYLEKSLELNKKIFKDIIILDKTDFPEFNSVYRHMSYNNEMFEKLCFLRFFNILEYCKENKIDKFLYCDSDAIFLENLNFENILGDELCVGCKPEEQNKFEDVTGAHFSIWSLEGLEDFCNFILDTYSKNIDILMPKWNWHIETQTGGGICDMTVMYHWYKGNKNLYDLPEGVFDRGLGISDGKIKNEFVIKNGIKQLKKEDDNVYVINNKDEKVKLLGLHFQGDKKRYMYIL